MEYKLKSGEKIKSVEVEIGKDNRFKAEIDRQKFEVSYIAVSDHHLNLSVNGKQFNVYTAGADQGKEICVNGRYYQLQDADSAGSFAKKTKADDGPGQITPATPSVVVSVLVKEGEIVEKGRGVIVLSAMKMEITLKAPYQGKVTRINAALGDKVAPGQILVDIDPASE